VVETYELTRQSEAPEPEVLEQILGGEERRPLPPASDGAAWQEVASRPWVRDALPALLERAERIAEAGLTPVRATDYLSFFRTGLRDAHNASAGRRTGAIALLTVAECLTRQGRFMDALLDQSWAAAEETSWVMPPHLRDGGKHMLPDAASPEIDLRAATLGRTLAEMIYVLGPQMDAVTPRWRERIQFELRRQVIQPFLNDSFFWQKTTSNWNAVCHDGVVATALLGGFDVETQARVLHAALNGSRRFLEGFTPDGGCTEGPGYWAYGVGHYCSLAYYVDCASGGRVDLLADPLVREVLKYAVGVVMTGRKVANFADCPPEVGFRSAAIAWAAGKLGASETQALASSRGGRYGLRSGVLETVLAGPPMDFRPPAEFFLPKLMLLVARVADRGGDELVLAAKGGHNAEHHNHNDVGAFIVHWHGESLICDLGAPSYTRQLFSDRRYELLATRGRGHDVPIVNGIEQQAGKHYRAEDFRLERSADAIGVSMELAKAYPPEAGLSSLRRRIILHRHGEGMVRLEDEVRFSSGSGTYELPLYTEGRFEPAGDGVVARGRRGALRLEFGAGATARIESFKHGDPRWEPRFGQELSRCTLSMQPDGAGKLSLKIIPEG